MKFLADESVESRIVQALRRIGFDVFSVAEECPAVSDSTVLNLCQKKKCVLITNDKDFGELVFLEKKVARGILLLRFDLEATNQKVQRVLDFLKFHKSKLEKNFVVLSEHNARIRKI